MPSSTTRKEALDEALAGFDAARREHQAFLASIPRERMTEPGATGPWSVKDVIAHLADWRSRSVARLEAAAAGKPEPPNPWPADLKEESDDDIDKINQWFYEQHRNDSLDDVLTLWDNSFDRLRAAFVALPDDALFKSDYFPWTEGTALIDAIPGGFLGHFHEEHEPTLRAWLASKGQGGS